MTRARHLLIESQRPAAMSERFTKDAIGLAATGAHVVLLFIQDGVFAAVRPDRTSAVRAALERGVEVWVDDFSLRQRALLAAPLVEGATIVDADRIAGAIVGGDGQVVWH